MHTAARPGRHEHDIKPDRSSGAVWFLAGAAGMFLLSMVMAAMAIAVLPAAFPGVVLQLVQRMQNLPAPNQGQPTDSRQVLPVMSGLDPALVERVHQFDVQLHQLADRIAATERRQMQPPISATHVESGSWLARKESQEWQLTNVFSKRRRLAQPITFRQPFATTPDIVLGITRIDAGQASAVVEISAQEPRQDGFLLVLETSSENRVRELQISWLAHGQPSTQPLSSERSTTGHPDPGVPEQPATVPTDTP